ncbi:MAG: sigma-E processing peptidase SpoIIGA [Clostridia bacterium]|nr:sigma-E processing peptidase SpoIIGA [Clostridia bacterium]
MTVYADILFLINFSMDFLSLCLAGRLTSERMERRRLLLSAACGSFLGTAAMFVLDGIVFVLCGLGCAVLMTRIAFGKQKRTRLFRGSVILWGTGTLLGGLMTSVLSAGDAAAVRDADAPFPAVFLLCFAVSSMLVRLAKGVSAKTAARVTVSAGGMTVSFDALCDSGCLLTEPISGMPVIVASAEVLGRIGEMLAEDRPVLRLRMIPADGVCGRCLLRGFVPDRVSADGRDISAVIACGGTGTDYGGYSGIIPARLVRR